MRRRVVSMPVLSGQQIHQMISVLPKLVLFLYSGFYLIDNRDQEQLEHFGRCVAYTLRNRLEFTHDPENGSLLWLPPEFE